MQLLLDAALLEKPEAIHSWHRYISQNNLQTISHAETTLLPLVYRNLQEESDPLCKSMYRHTWASNQTLWAKMLPTLHKLLDIGIDKIIVLKGMALILDHYRDFGLRVLGDIDILIDSMHLPLAYSFLTCSGWECTLRRFDPKNQNQLARWHAANFIHPSGLNLDVHWSPLLECSASIAQEFLQAVPPGIHPARATHLFFQTCVHGYKKSTAPLIRWIPDAFFLLKSSIDFASLFSLAKKTHLTLPLGSALSYLRTHFKAPIPSFHPQPSSFEKLEFRANQRGQIYLAAYFRARLQKRSLLHYLQHTANLSSFWLIFLYAPYWIFKRIYRFISKRCFRRIHE